MLKKILLARALFFWGCVYAITTPEPNLGDLRLKHVTEYKDTEEVSGILQVFFTDGSNLPTWSSVCSSSFGKLNEGQTACDQLGYESCSDVNRNVIRTEPDPVWLGNVSCHGQSFSHIFHCTYDLITNSSCSKIIELKCAKKKILNPDNLYDGQVLLCAPDSDDQSLKVQSVSTGVVVIVHYKEFGGLSFYRNEKALTEEITHYRGNLICQQQGSQQVVPGSIQTVASYRAAGYEFSNCQNGIGGSIHITTSWVSNQNLTCVSRNYKDDDCTSTITDPCFSCCYTQPHPNHDIVTSFENYVVLQCVYDIHTDNNPVPYGTKSKCQFGDEKNVGQYIPEYQSSCAAGASHSKDDGYIGWTTFSVIFIVVLLICCVISLYHNISFYRKRNYANIPEQNE